jgi:hypothetical protein
MKVCKVVVFIDGHGDVTFKGFVPPGGRICDRVHDGTIILIDGEPEGVTEITYGDMPSGRLIAFLSNKIQAKFEMGIYCIRNA